MKTAGAPVLVDGHGQEITLGAELGRGGEGTVYEIAGRGNGPRVVKLWHHGVVRESAALVAVAEQLAGGWPDRRR